MSSFGPRPTLIKIVVVIDPPRVIFKGELTRVKLLQHGNPKLKIIA